MEEKRNKSAVISDRVIDFFQAEDGIRYWSVTGVQNVCSSDLIRFSDDGKFANDQALGSVPSGMTPNGYGDFECLIPIATHNGGPAGTQARIYIKNGGVYIVGTDSASFVMIATTAYFS